MKTKNARRRHTRIGDWFDNHPKWERAAAYAALVATIVFILWVDYKQGNTTKPFPWP